MQFTKENSKHMRERKAAIVAARGDIHTPRYYRKKIQTNRTKQQEVRQGIADGRQWQMRLARLVEQEKELQEHLHWLITHIMAGDNHG